MPFLTIFTSPKPFSFNPHISIIQRNAIQSWIYLDPEVEVYLMGDEEGAIHVQTSGEFDRGFNAFSGDDACWLKDDEFI